MPLLAFRLLINTPTRMSHCRLPGSWLEAAPSLAAEGLAFSLLREVNGRKLGHRGLGCPSQQRTLLEQGPAAVVVEFCPFWSHDHSPLLQ